MKNKKAYHMNNEVTEINSCSLEEYQLCLV